MTLDKLVIFGFALSMSANEAFRESGCTPTAADSIGTVTLGAMATLLSFGSHDPPPTDYSKAVIRAIAGHMSVPNPLAFGIYGMRTSPGSSTRQLYPTFSDEFLLTFRENGSLKRLSMTQKSLAPAIDNAIAAAIRAADSAGAFPSVREATGKKEIDVLLDVDFSDCIGCVRSWPIFTSTVPLYAASRNVSEIRPSVAAKYPEELRRRRIEGDVAVRFVVDESGRIVPDAYRFIRVSEVDFGQEVRRNFSRLRFEPARIGNCPVKQLVQQSFNFRLSY